MKKSLISTALMAALCVSVTTVHADLTPKAPAAIAQATEMSTMKLKVQDGRFADKDNEQDDRKIPTLGCGEKQVLDLSTGVAAWKYGASNASVINPYQYWSTQVSTSNPAAKWINANNTNVAPQGTYNYTLTFKVKKCERQAFLRGIFSGDNDAKVFLDSTQLGATILAPHYGFMDGHQGVYNNVPLTPGIHTLRAEVYNLGSYAGFINNTKAHR